MKTIVIAGGTGFLGQVLEYYFSKKGYVIKILTRNPKKENHVYWNAKDLENWTNNLEGIDVLINLAGKSVDCRYNDKNKKLIYDSRIDSTHVLGLAINLCEKPPKIWMNSSTATIYKYSYDKEMSEEYGEFGNDFSMNIAKSWEAAFNTIKNPKTRKIVLRISIVLGRKGGAIIPFKRLTKFGLGGKQGNGQQKVSWIHELDFSRAIDFLIEKDDLNGDFNLCVPKPTNNTTLMAAFRKVLKIPFGLAQPKWFLELGAKIIGTETELVLKSRNVIPKRLTQNGFKFIHTSIELALHDLLNS